jgi:hypothetical protein
LGALTRCFRAKARIRAALIEQDVGVVQKPDEPINLIPSFLAESPYGFEDFFAGDGRLNVERTWGFPGAPMRMSADVFAREASSMRTTRSRCLDCSF